MMMTHLIQRLPGRTRLKQIQLPSFLQLGLAVAVLLTTGTAETLSHCPTALAESAPETDEPTALTLTSFSTAPFASKLATDAPFAYSGRVQVMKALTGEGMALVGTAIPLKRPVASHLALPVDTFQTSKAVGVAGSVRLTQPADIETDVSHQLQPLTLDRQAELQKTLTGDRLADSGVPAPSDKVLKQGSAVLGVPSIQLQGVFRQEGSDTSARGRVTTFYPVTPNAGFGAEVDLTTGNGFADSQETGLNLNELYFAGSLPSLPTLRFVVGLMDLTSYFDRNSFAKDGATHFFNSVFQTNPALTAAGIGSRPGLLVNWSVTDDIDLKATTFSSTRSLGDFHLDAFAGEIGVRFGTAIIRGTYVSSRDAGQRSGFREIFGIPRSGRLGPQPGDREEAYGINGEVFIPSLKLGLFGRYGRYTNLALDSSGTTYSAGLNFLDVFLPSDRLGLGYGRQLSNDDLRRSRGDRNPDVLELFYDFRITPNLRAAVTLEERNEFTETVVGVRIRTDFDLSPLFRRSR